MKNEEKISSLLGISQENLALLLGVSRSQISMYELGKRNLSLPAMEKLIQLLSHVKEDTLEEKTKPLEIDATFLQQLYQKNNYQLLITEKKIIAIQKKIKGLKKSTMLVTNIMKTKKIEENIEFDLLKTLVARTEPKKIEKYNRSLFQLQIKKEVLEFEKTVLEKYLQN